MLTLVFSEQRKPIPPPPCKLNGRSLKQSIGTAMLGPEMFSTDMPTHKATPLTEPRPTRGLHAQARETNHCSSTLADLQNYRICDTREPIYCDQAATPFQQIKP